MWMGFTNILKDIFLGKLLTHFLHHFQSQPDHLPLRWFHIAPSCSIFDHLHLRWFCIVPSCSIFGLGTIMLQDTLPLFSFETSASTFKNLDSRGILPVLPSLRFCFFYHSFSLATLFWLLKQTHTPVSWRITQVSFQESAGPRRQ